MDQSRPELDRLFREKRLPVLTGFFCSLLLSTENYLCCVIKFHLCSSIKAVDVLNKINYEDFSSFNGVLLL